MQSKYVCLALAAPMTMVLHGCGGGGTTTQSPGPTPPPGPAPTTTTTTTTTTTIAPIIGPTPWSEADAVHNLNWMYMHFKEDDDTSRLGLTISMASQLGSFNDNIFCHDLMGTSCYMGQADCRMSASLFNHKVLVSGDHLAPTMNRPVGYIINQTLVETQVGKCAYVWDGADFTKLNNGCGNGATSTDCNSQDSAFANMCDGHTCTRDDHQVSSQFCKGSGYGVVDPPTDPSGATCFYEMPGLVYGHSTTTNNLRDALKFRVSTQGDNPNMTANWNEIVLDDRLLVPAITANPEQAIWAFVCVHGGSALPNACDLARSMRDKFKTDYNVQGDIPVVMMDATADFRTTHGPFALASTSEIIA